MDGLPVPAGRKGFVDRPLLPGTYLYEISCGYPAVPDLPGDGGELVWSPGLRVAATSVEWPSPVEDVTVRSLEGGTVTIDWRPRRAGTGVWWSGPACPWRRVTMCRVHRPRGRRRARVR